MLYQLSYSRGGWMEQKYNAAAARASRNRRQPGGDGWRMKPPMTATRLSPATCRLLGWMFLWTGILLGLGQLIRLGIAAYAWSLAGIKGTLEVGLVSLYILGLVGASLLVRYGRQLLRGRQIADGPAEETIL